LHGIAEPTEEVNNWFEWLQSGQLDKQIKYGPRQEVFYWEYKALVVTSTMLEFPLATPQATGTICDNEDSIALCLVLYWWTNTFQPKE